MFFFGVEFVLLEIILSCLVKKFVSLEFFVFVIELFFMVLCKDLLLFGEIVGMLSMGDFRSIGNIENVFFFIELVVLFFIFGI